MIQSNAGWQRVLLVLLCLGLMGTTAMAGDVEFKSRRCVTEEPTVDRCNEFTFDATGSYDPNNKKISIKWDFGDGTTSDQPVVTHRYDRGGDYNVTLTVTNNTGVSCDTSTATQMVTVNLPPTAMFTAPETLCAGGTVTLDASASTDDTPENLSYAWDFGDGTSDTGKVVKKEFKKGGLYPVKLTVNDGANTVCSMDAISRTIRVNSAPTAVAGKDMDLCMGAADSLKVTVDGSASSDPDKDTLSYTWDFGDGTTETGRRVTHTYAQTGTYKVTLTVDDGSGTDCNMSTSSMKVSLYRAPMAECGADVSACVGDDVPFDGSGSTSGSGKGLSYRWDFGDGTTAQGAQVTHVYQKGGMYKATLTVDDGTGMKCSTNTDVRNVEVVAPPVAKLAKVGVVCAGDKVVLDASGSSDPNGNALKYVWDFGDGKVEESGSKVAHVYEKGGQYTVKVTVDKVMSGSKCDPVSPMTCTKGMAMTDVIVNTPPIVDAGPNLVCCAGKETMFDGSFSSDADGDALSYMWDFGDGATAEGAKTSHVYKKAGTYKVVLTVDDNKGTKCSRGSDSFLATVLEKPVSVIKVK